jgi:serine/threonine protein kinase
VTLCVANGLKKLHGENMIRQDLKPSNILINEDDIFKLGFISCYVDIFKIGFFKYYFFY